MEGSNDSLPVVTSTLPGGPAVLLTPGRTRNIAQDMEALRLSRQDNPYLQQVMASRESLIESHADECEADDTILMSQEFGSTAAFDFVEEDPLTLKEVHEHMIRSPPPISSWPHDGLSCRTSSAFTFSEASLRGATSGLTYTSIDEQDIPCRSPRRSSRASRSVSPRTRDCSRPLSLPGEVCGARFSLAPRPLRRHPRDDSVRLVADH